MFRDKTPESTLVCLSLWVILCVNLCMLKYYLTLYSFWLWIGRTKANFKLHNHHLFAIFAWRIAHKHEACFSKELTFERPYLFFHLSYIKYLAEVASEIPWSSLYQQANPSSWSHGVEPEVGLLLFPNHWLVSFISLRLHADLGQHGRECNTAGTRLKRFIQKQDYFFYIVRIPLCKARGLLEVEVYVRSPFVCTRMKNNSYPKHWTG